jgi:type IV pilus assembly protein PilV
MATAKQPIKTPLRNQQSGVMLIEALIAILLFSIGILGLVGLQTISTQNSVNAGERTIAGSLANDMVSQMWLRNTTDISTVPLKTDLTAWQTKVASALPNASGNVASSNGIATITISWKSPSKKNSDNQNKLETSVAITP